jgi:hypothetical protein
METEYKITKKNLQKDLIAIMDIIENKPNISVGEYIQLCEAKKIIVERLIKRQYPQEN